MAILEIDTDILRQTVSTAKQTNDAITEALNLLNQVVIHNDWKCIERNTINNHTIENRTQAQTIQGWSSGFYGAIEQSSNLFDEAEQFSISQTNTLDDIIGQIATIVPGSFTAASAGSAVSNAGAVVFNDVKESLGG